MAIMPSTTSATDSTTYPADIAHGRQFHGSSPMTRYGRMPDFLMRCEALVGTTPPRSIAEGLVTQTTKNPAIMQAFPQLQMNVQMFRSFLQNVQPYMKDRARGGRELFDQYHGYYPYYYFFGNLKATRKSDNKEHASSNAGVN